MKRLREGLSDPYLRGAALLTVAIVIYPLLLYGVGRLDGNIPTPDRWFNVLGRRHGPWHGEAPGALVVYPLLWLIPATGIIGVWRASRHGRRFMLPGTESILVAQIVGLLLHLKYLSWTID